MNQLTIKNNEASVESLEKGIGTRVINFQAPGFQSSELKFENLCTAFVERGKNLQNKLFGESTSSYDQFIGKFSVAQFCLPLEDPRKTLLSTSVEAINRSVVHGNKIKTRPRKKPHKNSDFCLLPKKGTAKPRQSKQRKMCGMKKSGKDPRSKNYYAGARVKETVREKLERLRAQKKQALHNKMEQSMKRKNPYVTTPLRMLSNDYLAHKATPKSPTSGKINEKWVNHSPVKPHTKEAIKKIFLTIQALDSKKLTTEEFSCELDKIGPTDNIILDKDNTTFLHYISRNGTNRPINENEAIITAINSRFGTNGLNRQNNKGETPLHVAVTNKNIGAINALLQNGADLSITDFLLHETVIHRAIRLKNIRILSTMMIYSPLHTTNTSVLDIQNIYGKTALHLACEMLGESGGECSVTKQMISLLLDRSLLSPHIKNNEGVTPYMILSNLAPSLLLALNDQQPRTCFSEEDLSVYDLQDDNTAPPQSMPTAFSGQTDASFYQEPFQSVFDYNCSESPTANSMDHYTITPTAYVSSPQSISSLRISPHQQQSFITFSPNSQGQHENYGQFFNRYEPELHAHTSPTASPHYQNISNLPTTSSAFFFDSSTSNPSSSATFLPSTNLPSMSSIAPANYNFACNVPQASPSVPFHEFNKPSPVPSIIPGQSSSNNNNNVPTISSKSMAMDMLHYLPPTSSMVPSDGLRFSSDDNVNDFSDFSDIFDDGC